MKILIASTGVPGHLNPLLTAANILIQRNHEVIVQTSPEMQSRVDAAGIPFISSPTEVDMEQFFEDREAVAPGIDRFRYDVEELFTKEIPPQSAALKATLRNFPADLILVDNLYMGTLPMLLGPREERSAIAHMGITVLNLGSGKNVPPRPGTSPEEQIAEQARRKRTLLIPVQTAVNKVLSQMGCGALPCPLLESMSTLPDLYLHPGIRSFEYPDESLDSSSVHYIGSLPLPPGQSELPEWWNELDRTKRLVLVTQGTLANRDLGQLIGPTLTALANEKDLIVLVTTGGHPAESIPVEIPANARVAEFLPYQKVFPDVDLLITNGGYGTVNMALAHAIPIISAGMTEDKEEVSAHVQWSGAGIDLRTNQATADEIHAATKKIFESPAYRNRAKELAAEFKRHNSEVELVSLIEECVSEEIPATK
jgi:MGT family glycosyltransferase